MEEVKQQALNRALVLLKAVGCKYFVVGPDDVRYVEGDLHIAEPSPEKKRIRKMHRKHGDLVRYYRPLIQNMEVGNCVSVPYGPFDSEREELAGAISAWCAQNWGAKTAMTHTTDTEVEVLRIA
jgi:hypothetical protein